MIVQIVLPKGINPALVTRSCGNTVQYPKSMTTALTKTDGTQALVKLETISPII